MKLAGDDRLNNEYEIGVESFIKYAFGKTGEKEKIKCPCVKCKNSSFGSPNMVRDHLLTFGIIQSYNFWYHHGERVGEDAFESPTVGDDDGLIESDGEDEMETPLRDFFPNNCGFAENDMHDGSSSTRREDPNDEAMRFYRLFDDFQKPLYEGSISSTLSAIVNLLHIKTLGRWSNESFTMLLNFLKTQLLPKESSLPDCFNDAKKIVKDLGLSYEKIDACVNDCMLFWKDDEQLEHCKVCKAARWKQGKHSGETRTRENGKRIPQKVLRYFPLKPRLQRLFMCSKTASDMRWHNERQAEIGVLNHPSDGKAWQDFDENHPSFSSEPRNVRLGLISDGFNPFSNIANPYSIWPVMLVPYNLPPWVCMTQSSMMLSMLVPGPKGPGDAIDVYLQPLIEELKELWEVGVETYDASKCENFKMHAALLTTINDFPAYGILSGWSTKGKLACPCCHKKTAYLRLKNCCKHVYMRHRRFLHIKHSWRKKKDVFGKKEKGEPPKPLSGEEVLQQAKDLKGFCLSKDPTKRTKVCHKTRGDNWNKLSIFFELPYWKTLLLRHSLDVMHIEKNICDIILGTIMNIKGKTKDTTNSRLDMEELGIMSKLHPIKKGDKTEIPHAPYTLTKSQKEILCRFLKDLKVPDGFSANISRCVNVKDSKISGLKSHDCHVLLQSILPLVIRGLLVKDVAEPLIELCQFFSVLCAKSVKVKHLEEIKAQIPLTLSKLEAWMPPSCFDVMLHLSVHLADEVILGGPVQFRWMYPGERYLHNLKLYVRNKARLEGSIAEGYLVDECMTLCSRYLDEIETRFNRLERNDDGDKDDSKKLSIFSHAGRPLGARKNTNLDVYEREQAHIYALKNCSEVEPFLQYVFYTYIFIYFGFCVCLITSSMLNVENMLKL